MQPDQIAGVRRFNRLVTRRIGALSGSYLARGRPLGEARLMFELGEDGLDLSVLRMRMRVDAAYLSRLLRSLEHQSLVVVCRDVADGRRRRAVLTERGRKEVATYDGLSDELAASILDPLRPTDRDRLVAAMAEVERLLRAGEVRLDLEPPSSRVAQACRDAYFAELEQRFEEGFDLALGRAARDDAMVPTTGAFLVARLDGEPVGCGGFARLDDGSVEIKRMWTAAPMRGLGIARRILGELERLAWAAGYDTVRLDTNRALGEAQAFYRRDGYREIERYNDNPYADLWFEKRLTRDR